jgi:hypothetical protein
MEIPQALRILRALADGVDPHTGEVFAESSLIQHPDTVRALFRAISELERRHAKTENRQSPQNAGKAWDGPEDTLLCQAFDAGKTVKELSVEHERTEGAIRSRLIKHGKITI